MKAIHYDEFEGLWVSHLMDVLEFINFYGRVRWRDLMGLGLDTKVIRIVLRRLLDIGLVYKEGGYYVIDSRELGRYLSAISSGGEVNISYSPFVQPKTSPFFRFAEVSLKLDKIGYQVDSESRSKYDGIYRGLKQLNRDEVDRMVSEVEEGHRDGFIILPIEPPASYRALRDPLKYLADERVIASSSYTHTVMGLFWGSYLISSTAFLDYFRRRKSSYCYIRRLDGYGYGPTQITLNAFLDDLKAIGYTKSYYTNESDGFRIFTILNNWDLDLAWAAELENALRLDVMIRLRRCISDRSVFLLSVSSGISHYLSPYLELAGLGHEALASDQAFYKAVLGNYERSQLYLVYSPIVRGAHSKAISYDIYRFYINLAGNIYSVEFILPPNTDMSYASYVTDVIHALMVEQAIRGDDIPLISRYVYAAATGNLSYKYRRRFDNYFER